MRGAAMSSFEVENQTASTALSALGSSATERVLDVDHGARSPGTANSRAFAAA